MDRAHHSDQVGTEQKSAGQFLERKGNRLSWHVACSAAPWVRKALFTGSIVCLLHCWRLNPGPPHARPALQGTDLLDTVWLLHLGVGDIILSGIPWVETGVCLWITVQRTDFSQKDSVVPGFGALALRECGP